VNTPTASTHLETTAVNAWKDRITWVINMFILRIHAKRQAKTTKIVVVVMMLCHFGRRWRPCDVRALCLPRT